MAHLNPTSSTKKDDPRYFILSLAIITQDQCGGRTRASFPPSKKSTFCEVERCSVDIPSDLNLNGKGVVRAPWWWIWHQVPGSEPTYHARWCDFWTMNLFVGIYRFFGGQYGQFTTPKKRCCDPCAWTIVWTKLVTTCFWWPRSGMSL